MVTYKLSHMIPVGYPEATLKTLSGYHQLWVRKVLTNLKAAEA